MAFAVLRTLAANVNAVVLRMIVGDERANCQGAKGCNGANGRVGERRAEQDVIV